MIVDKDIVRAEYEKGGYTYQKVADYFKISVNTVKSWAKRDKDEGNPWIKGNGKKVATNNKKLQLNKKVATEDKESEDIDNNNIRLNTTESKEQTSKTNSQHPKARPGNKNAIGNKGGPGAPEGNDYAETHGFFSKYLPEETLELTQLIQEKPYIDILWENITIQYAAIIRAQRIMYVTEKEEMIKELKKSKIKTKSKGTEKTTSEEREEEFEYEFQFSWDRQATFLQAQSRAMSELRSMIKQYDDLVNNGLVTEEQRLRIEKLKQDINNAKGIDEADNQGVQDFIKATSMSEEEIKELFEDEDDEDGEEEAD